MIQEMLEDGLIIHSKCYYSTLVVMVHMKYGLNYRDPSHPFNASTVATSLNETL